MSGSSGNDRVPPRRPRRFPEIERRAASMNALDLEPLMTVCPKCGTRFRVTESQLQAARGRVRCGACGSIFDGVDQLVLDMPREFTSSHDAERALDELMAELMTDARVVPPPVAAESPPYLASTDRVDVAPAGAPPAEFPDAAANACAPATEPPPESELRPEPEGPPVAEPAVGPEPEPAIDAAGSEPVVAPPAAEPVEQGETAPGGGVPSPVAHPVVFGQPRRRRRLWILPALLLGALAVAAQVLWFQFDALVRDPAWRPVYTGVCGWVGCELPVQRALNRIRTRNLTVESAGEGSGTLVVRVLIVNEADFPQPFPTLELRFSELSGVLAAGHRFQPREYLSGDARDMELMPVGTPVQLELRIPDPGPHAVNYQLNLR